MNILTDRRSRTGTSTVAPGDLGSGNAHVSDRVKNLLGISTIRAGWP